MHKTVLAIILLAFVSASGFADQKAPAASLKVDLTEVVTNRVVAPVDGISAAGQPDEAAFKVFADQGYKTIIDLRAAGENRGLDEPAVVEELGMTYINLPVAGLDAISFDNARKLDKLIANSEGPVLLHCGSANRVGALLALSKSLEGADDDTALEFGREAGMTGLESRVKEVLAEK